MDPHTPSTTFRQKDVVNQCLENGVLISASVVHNRRRGNWGEGVEEGEMERRSRREGRNRGGRTEGGLEGGRKGVMRMSSTISRHWHRLKLQALVYDILPSTPAVFSSAIGS